MIAIDTNILLYSLDQKFPVKQAKARYLLSNLSGSTATILPWQMLGELLQQLRNWRDRGRITDAEMNFHFACYRNTFPIRLPTKAVLDHALDLAARYSLSHWDSMLLGACLDAGVTTLYTEDMGSPRTIDTIHLVDPLV